MNIPIRRDLELLRCYTVRMPHLQKIARSLHKLDEKHCNYGLSPKDDKRAERLMNSADEMAATFGLKAFHQADPRGGTLYLVPKSWSREDVERRYHDGIHITRG